MQLSNKYLRILLNIALFFFVTWALDMFHSKSLSYFAVQLIKATLVALAIYYFEEKAKKKAASKLING